jgi:putative chitinase
MVIAVTLDQVLLLAPSARSSYREAFNDAQPVLEHYAISATRLRIIHFLAQVLHESAGLTIQFENLNYSAARLSKVWPSRFKPEGPLEPADYAHDPRKLGNQVYGQRMGNTAPDDGFTYRGRGLLQLTGKGSYVEITTLLRHDVPSAPDFAAAPDEVISAQWCLAVAAGEWSAKGCNALADEDSIRKVTRAINGGQVGLADRIEWEKRARAIWGNF